MKLIAALTISVSILAAQTERGPQHSVTAVRHWSLSDSTRIIVEVSGEFTFVSERLHNPERIYFDIPHSRPRIESRRIYSEQIDDKLVKRIRVAETHPGVTRVVVDLEGPTEISSSQLTNPNRLIVELRAASGPAIPTSLPSAISSAPTPAPIPEPLRPTRPVDSATPESPKLDSAKTEPARPDPAKRDSPARDSARPESTKLDSAKSDSSKRANPAKTESARPEISELAKPDASKSEAPKVEALPAAKSSVTPSTRSDALAELPVEAKPAVLTDIPMPPSEISKAARHTSSGQTSLVRALGLKVGRVVIDPGHGGHDQGTGSPKGLLEKELVLDIAKRVGKLVEDRMGAEVVYTRTDDTFVPLEGRTAIANEKKADLFLSIHANSSPIVRISGVETYYLNFTDSKDALDVASRENASSQKSIFELRDIIQKITLHDKAEESREFASRIQTSLYGFSAKNFPNSRNRGVKKAPFVVLIGANMPSVLAEIGFLSNTREETLLKKPDYRQKLAEALFRGLSRYADSLSHFQTVAQAQD